MSAVELSERADELHEEPTPPRGLTLDRVYPLSALGVAVAAALCTIVRPFDYWWHVAMGRLILATGEIPAFDTFTFTQQGEPFYNQMWLSQVFMYLLHRLGDVHLVVVAHAVVIGLAYAMLLSLMIRLTRRPRLSGLLLLAVVLPLSFSNWAVRPQPYAFPLFVAFVAILLYPSAEHPPWRLWLLPVLMVLWVNIHGSFMLGLGLVSLAAVVGAIRGRIGDADESASPRALPWVAVATWLAVCVNPRGPNVLRYVLDLTTNDSVATVTEWQPLTPRDFASVLYFLVAAALVLILVYGRRRPPPLETVSVVVFMLLGFSAQRHTTWFALIAAPVLAVQVSSMLKRRRTIDPGIPAMNAVLVAILAIAIIAALPWARQAWAPEPLGLVVRETPVEATAALADLEERPARLFNDLGYGSYLAWQMPMQKTFIDPRFELFPVSQVEDYDAMSEARDVSDLVEKYRIDGFLVSHEYQPRLIRHLRDSSAWRVAHDDREAILFLPE